MYGQCKRPMGQRHPDRFSGDTAANENAEERRKQLTIAYQALGNYRRAYGVIPPGKPAIDVGAQTPRRHTDTVSEHTSSNDHRAATGAIGATVSEPSKSSPGRRRRVVLAIFIIVPSLYLVDRYAGPSHSAPDPDTPTTRPDTATQAPSASPRDSGWVWIGSTVGKVYAPPGLPTFTQGETWHYGKSQIPFAQGQVISWNQHPHHPSPIAPSQPPRLHA